MIKKVSLAIFISILFTACSGETDDTNNVGNKKIYETESFSIAVPQDWEILERSDLGSNIPESTVVAFRNNIKNEIFTANLNISSGTVDENISSIDMAKKLKENTKNSLISYTDLGDENYQFPYGGDAIPTIITFYQGRQAASEPLINFRQLNVAINGIGYSLTAGYSPDEEETVVKFIDEMIDSFALK